MSQPLNPIDFPLWGSRLIEASAGTGKTWTIAALYLRLVLGHGGEAGCGRPLQPAEILVMTFTRAATRELADRIRARLLEAARCFRGETAPAPGDALLADLLEAYPDEAGRAGAAWRQAMAAEGKDEAEVRAQELAAEAARAAEEAAAEIRRNQARDAFVAEAEALRQATASQASPTVSVTPPAPPAPPEPVGVAAAPAPPAARAAARASCDARTPCPTTARRTGPCPPPRDAGWHRP